jgi:hypothetical protein
MTQAVEKTSAGVTVTNDQFTYDADNRRIGKSINGTQVWFGYTDTGLMHPVPYFHFASRTYHFANGKSVGGTADVVLTLSRRVR